MKILIISKKIIGTIKILKCQEMMEFQESFIKLSLQAGLLKNICNYITESGKIPKPFVKANTLKQFLRMIRTLYKASKAQMKVNGLHYEIFKITKNYFVFFLEP